MIKWGSRMLLLMMRMMMMMTVWHNGRCMKALWRRGIIHYILTMMTVILKWRHCCTSMRGRCVWIELMRRKWWWMMLVVCTKTCCKRVIKEIGRRVISGSSSSSIGGCYWCCRGRWDHGWLFLLMGTRKQCAWVLGCGTIVVDRIHRLICWMINGCCCSCRIGFDAEWIELCMNPLGVITF